MWEITISCGYQDIVYLLEMENTLNRVYGKDVMTIITMDEDIICNIAVIKNSLIDDVKKIIIETMIKCLKSNFFSDNLKLNNNDISLNSFMVSSLVMIELLEEVEYVYNNFEIKNHINFKSFIYFKLTDFIDKWQYICDYINNLILDNNEEVIYLEFLKFISCLQKPKYDVLYLEHSNKNLLLYDCNHKKLKKIEITDEVGVIANLIMLSPKKIIINCHEKLTDKVSQLINYIFDDKLCFLL